MLGTNNIISLSSLYSFNSKSFGIVGHKSLRLENKPLTIGLDVDTMPPSTSYHHFSSFFLFIFLLLLYPKRATIPFLFINSTFKICLHLMGCGNPLLGHVPRLIFVSCTHINMIRPYSINSPLLLCTCNKCQETIKAN
jgi:hypothetical protein